MSMSKILRRSNGGGPYLFFWCPGCDTSHMVAVAPHPKPWDWNGDIHRPTFGPSILTWGRGEDERRCHSFVTDGVIRFLDDCTHPLRGNHPLPDWPRPDWGGVETMDDATPPSPAPATLMENQQ